MQLLPVNETPGRHVTDLRVVLPGVPEPADDLDVVGGLEHQLAARRVQQRHRAAPEVPRVIGRCRDLDPYSGPPLADEIQRGDRLGDVERLGVRRDHRGHQPDTRGQGRDPGGDQHRVRPPGDLVGAPRREAQAVLDGHEVNEPALGLENDIHPVRGGQQLRGTS
jgi:hypothetical protein